DVCSSDLEELSSFIGRCFSAFTPQISYKLNETAGVPNFFRMEAVDSADFIYVCVMRMRQDRIFIPLTVPKTVLDKYDGPYFYHQGVAVEETVRDQEEEKRGEASFEGVGVMGPF